MKLRHYLTKEGGQEVLLCQTSYATGGAPLTISSHSSHCPTCQQALEAMRSAKRDLTYRLVRLGDVNEQPVAETNRVARFRWRLLLPFWPAKKAA